MKTLRIATAKPYDVLIGNKILADVGQIIKHIDNYPKVAIITDDIVGALYGKDLTKNLNDEGIDVHSFVFPNGERSKNIEVLGEIYSFLIRQQISRSDLIIAIGGGVVGDLAGFAAASYLWGLDYIQIPTTLIAQTDSSVGGKTAVNLKHGKNLMGLFYQPRLVICDVSLLKEPFLIREGISEVIKYALLADRELFELLERGELNERLEEVVARCVKIKGIFVSQDERDQGKRKLLNLGHTIGHGIEKNSGYKVPHGIAVGIGMAIMLSACVNNGLLDKKVYERYLRLLKKFDLPTSYKDTSLEELTKEAISDKKRSGNDINIVICKDIGNCEVKKIRMDELFHFLSR